MVNIDRRKLPVLALGHVDPIAYGRGFRIISGIIDYVILTKDLLLELTEKMDSNVGEVVVSQDEYDLYDPVQDFVYGDHEGGTITVNDANGNPVLTLRTMKPVTLDMLPPIDVIVYGVEEETGALSGMLIKGLEFTSSSYVLTVNDVALAQRAEWIAK
jgi:hypothetical protein